MLQDGCLDFVIAQNAQEQGYQIVKQLFEYLMLAQKPADYFYEIPIQVITRELSEDSCPAQCQKTYLLFFYRQKLRYVPA